MSDYKLCPSCTNVKVNKDNQIYSIDTKKILNTHQFIPLFNNKDNGDEKLIVKLGKQYANCLIYYYSSRDKQQQHFEHRDMSYQNSSNIGLKKLDDNGDVILYLNCPQHYIEHGKSYMSHIHIIVSNKNMTTWSNKLITFNVLCNIKKSILKQHIKTSDRLIINALPEDYHKKSSIPTSYNIYYKDAKKMNTSQLKTKIKQLVKDNKKFNIYINKHKISFLDIPICVYCYDTTCSAGHELANELYRVGFTNIIDYKGGIVDWDNK
jgi:hypothetical protein